MVKLARDVGRNLFGGGSVRDWLGHATQYISFGLIGGLVSMVMYGSSMLDPRSRDRRW
ncbi:hypothetical protein [Nocardia aurantiaca]|uniref:Uncharacterized protein n=1 Tax=Nocardia aurantiaca TaxID=2675850 RepID=A0A6I3L687_9NOCA|nr:hypothetical protein [Nocardia aurantiaca]MTE17407.1 hypothetical protein [Nocardia aurantiaca]